jgi:hypothetical protein
MVDKAWHQRHFYPNHIRIYLYFWKKLQPWILAKLLLYREKAAHLKSLHKAEADSLPNRLLTERK